MAVDTQMESRNGWVVHSSYGVGKIKGKTVRTISGEETEYYKIEIANGTVYVPVDDYDDDQFRALASKNEFKRALEVLERPARPMEGNFQKRKARIRRVQKENSILAIARLVRDLSARRSDRSLSNTEEEALRQFKERLLVEWSTCQNIDMQEAQQRLVAALHHVPS